MQAQETRECLPLTVQIECVDVHSTAAAPRPQRTSLIGELLFWCAVAAASTQTHLLQHCTAMLRSSSAMYALCIQLTWLSRCVQWFLLRGMYARSSVAQLRITT
jgi:hypothetical protein